MENNSNGPMDDRDETRWVDERLQSLEGNVRPNLAAGQARLRDRGLRATRRRRRTWTASAIATGAIVVLAMPWPRAAAQRLWDRLTLSRIEIVQVARPNLPESVTAVFTMD